MSRRHRRWRDRHNWQDHVDAAGSAFASMNPHRLRRHRRGKLLGVCAGIADYLGVRRGLVRGAAIVGLIFFPWFVGLAYIALAFILPQQAEAEPEPPREDTEFWRGMTIKPTDTFSALRFRFRELEERLASLETEVTHPDYSLKRQFRDLN